jgi:hypothetical protein
MNKMTGMIVAGIMVLIVAGVVIKSVVFPSGASPTIKTSKTGFMEIIEVEAKITDVLGAAPSGSGDAADHYVRAVELFYANFKLIEGAGADLNRGDAQNCAEALKKLEEMRGHIGKGAKQAKMNYLAKHATIKMKGSQRQKDVERLGLTIDALDMLGKYYILNKRLKDANDLYRDMFVAGWHMIEARSHWDMIMYGESIQRATLETMLKSIETGLDEDTEYERKAPLRDYRNALIEFRSRYQEKGDIFRHVRLEAGDIWNIAENDKDRSWRVQAILAMGMLKFTHAGKADAARNNALIERFLNSKDPLEKAAAEATKAYTEADFNLAGTTW